MTRGGGLLPALWCDQPAWVSRKPRTSASSTDLSRNVLADPAREQEGQGARVHLLVVEHVRDERRAVGVDARSRQRRRASAVARRCAATRAASCPGTGPSPPNSRTPAPCPPRRASPWSSRSEKPVFGLQRVAEGMAEIEQRAPAGRLALVLGDDPRLGRDRMRDRVCACAADRPRATRGRWPRTIRRRRNRRSVRISPPRHSLRGPRARAACRASCGSISTQRGLVERADQILAGACVDRGLAADRRIDLREQGRRDLDEAAAALEDRGGEADEIADHAATERDDMIAALDAEFEQPVGQRFERAPSSWSPRRARARSPRSRTPAAGQRGLQRGQDACATFSSVTIAIVRPRASGARWSPARSSSPASIIDVIAALAERHRDTDHFSSAFRMAFTVVVVRRVVAGGSRIGASA